MSHVDPYDLDRTALARLVEELGEPRYRATQIRAWLVRGIDDPQAMTDLPSALRVQLADRFAGTRPRLVEQHRSDGGRTHKLLMALADGETIECVVMRYPDRITVCVSTQAGCAMGCPFCATGQAGLRRQLTAGEIVRQVVLADTALREGILDDTAAVTVADRVTNVVYMGMGEPLANLDATISSLRWLHDPDGFGLSARSITVSTVGLVPGMRRLSELGLPVTLAVSLHAATDVLRDELVPINTVHPIAELEAAIRAYRDRVGRRVSLEWCLIGGVNDDLDQADRLAAIARRVRAHVNVIPMNPTPGVTWREPSVSSTRRFVDQVRRGGARVTLRDTRGRDADAACGQLAATYTLGSGRRLPVSVGAEDRVDARLARRQVGS